MSDQMKDSTDQLHVRLENNEAVLRSLFQACDDVSLLKRRYGKQLRYKALSIYCDTLVQQQKKDILTMNLQNLGDYKDEALTDLTVDDVIFHFECQGMSTSQFEQLHTVDQVVKDVLNGHVVLLFDGWTHAISISTLSVDRRKVSEPALESVVMGPREGAVENLQTNIGLLRLRLKTPRFKLEQLTAGHEKNSEIMYGYLDGVVNAEMLAEFKRRISTIQDKEIMDTSYIEELIEDESYSPFPQHRYTERPDVATAALLGGKIIVLMDGTPMILVCPGLFIEFFQSSEDYYQRTWYSIFIRTLRICAFVIALSLSSVYIALSTFHPELIPTVLLLTVLKSREGIPFPAFVEAIIMEFLFELLREAGIRLPQPIGSAVSIVGALIVGEAAITAGIASPVMVVIVALAGIASFSLPQYNMAAAIRVIRFPLMALAAAMGGFGLMIGMLVLLLHLTKLRSLGQPYLTYIAPFRPKKMKDVFIRVPLKKLLRSTRGKQLHVEQKRLRKKGGQ